ncbi:hypothetical protein ACRWQ1_000568 [Neisseria gonorrhoeae]
MPSEVRRFGFQMALPACVKRYSDTARHKTLPRIPPPVVFTAENGGVPTEKERG